MLRYHGKIGRLGDGGKIGNAEAKDELVDSPVSGDANKGIEEHEERHEENHETQPADPVTQAPDKGQQEQNDQNNAN